MSRGVEVHDGIRISGDMRSQESLAVGRDNGVSTGNKRTRAVCARVRAHACLHLQRWGSSQEGGKC